MARPKKGRVTEHFIFPVSAEARERMNCINAQHNIPLQWMKEALARASMMGWKEKDMLDFIEQHPFLGLHEIFPDHLFPLFESQHTVSKLHDIIKKAINRDITPDLATHAFWLSGGNVGITERALGLKNKNLANAYGGGLLIHKLWAIAEKEPDRASAIYERLMSQVKSSGEPTEDRTVDEELARWLNDEGVSVGWVNVRHLRALTHLANEIEVVRKFFETALISPKPVQPGTTVHGLDIGAVREDLAPEHEKAREEIMNELAPEPTVLEEMVLRDLKLALRTTALSYAVEYFKKPKSVLVYEMVNDETMTDDFKACEEAYLKDPDSQHIQMELMRYISSEHPRERVKAVLLLGGFYE